VIIVSTSMAAVPLVMRAADRLLARFAAQAPAREFDSLADARHPIIIAGFGRFGQIVGRALTVHGYGVTALESSTEQIDFLRRFGIKIYYGDASRLDLLRAAHADEARAFVLAIDDIEASVRTATVVKKNFPSLPIYARARNRKHAHELMDLGVRLVTRETFFSAVHASENILRDLGMEAENARESMALFVRRDEEILVRQHAVHHDEQQLIQTSQQARAELQDLFEQDAARRAQRRADDSAPPPTSTSSPPDTPPEKPSGH
jgi:glutathione-regulated potassium-efflux system ancillary protein KefC/glutathione-regulated potassium-efflux system protein KefB